MGKQNSILILGSGTSTGTPIPSCHCSTCNSDDPKNHRFRTSALIQTATKKNILIDTTPDLRSQALINRIEYIDGVIITHDHADHIHGIDDLRPFCFGPPLHSIPLWTSSYNAQTMIKRFPYIFPSHQKETPPPQLGGGIPLIDLHQIELSREKPMSATICDENFSLLTLPHGPHGESMGIIHGKMAYLTDISDIPESISNHLKSLHLELLFIDCVRHKFHPTHLNVKQVTQHILNIAPQKAGLIHMNHDIEHRELAAQLEQISAVEIFPTFDGQLVHYS